MLKFHSYTAENFLLHQRTYTFKTTTASTTVATTNNNDNSNSNNNKNNNNDHKETLKRENFFLKSM